MTTTRGSFPVDQEQNGVFTFIRDRLMQQIICRFESWIRLAATAAHCYIALEEANCLVWLHTTVCPCLWSQTLIKIVDRHHRVLWTRCPAGQPRHKPQTHVFLHWKQQKNIQIVFSSMFKDLHTLGPLQLPFFLRIYLQHMPRSRYCSQCRLRHQWCEWQLQLRNYYMDNMRCF